MVGKSKRWRSVEDVVCTREMINGYTILIGMPERKIYVLI
jgi:hypothetical protein